MSHEDAEALEPDLQICDAHHHLWDLPSSPEMLPGLGETTYLLPQLLSDVTAGHAVRSSVFVDSSAFYRAGGDHRLRFIGETEFANGVAAMSASNRYGDSRLCAAIVGRVNLLRAEEEVAEVLEAHLGAGGGRFRGVRLSAAYDATGSVMLKAKQAPAELCLAPVVHRNLKRLAELGLSLDVWVYHEQLPEVAVLADAVPALQIVLNHVGTPLGVGYFAERRDEVHARWRRHLTELARRPNVFVKLGGLGLPFCGSLSARPEATSGLASEVLANRWRPYIEQAIELFGPRRSMFESNFPAERGCCDYVTLWNTFKRITWRCSDDEKGWLYDRAARGFYRIAAS